MQFSMVIMTVTYPTHNSAIHQFNIIALHNTRILSTIEVTFNRTRNHSMHLLSHFAQRILVEMGGNLPFKYRESNHAHCTQYTTRSVCLRSLRVFCVCRLNRSSACTSLSMCMGVCKIGSSLKLQGMMDGIMICIFDEIFVLSPRRTRTIDMILLSWISSYSKLTMKRFCFGFCFEYHSY